MSNSSLLQTQSNLPVRPFVRNDFGENSYDSPFAVVVSGREKASSSAMTLLTEQNSIHFLIVFFSPRTCCIFFFLETTQKAFPVWFPAKLLFYA